MTNERDDWLEKWLDKTFEKIIKKADLMAQKGNVDSKHTEETKKKMSEANKGEKHTDDTSINLSGSFFRKVNSFLEEVTNPSPIEKKHWMCPSCASTVIMEVLANNDGVMTRRWDYTDPSFEEARRADLSEYTSISSYCRQCRYKLTTDDEFNYFEDKL